MIVGKGEFIKYIKEELAKLGFCIVKNIEVSDESFRENKSGILIEYLGDGLSQSEETGKIPIIYPFDFIEGAGVIVLFPDDDREFICKKNIRLWAAEYMSGYCSFWNMEGSDWLQDVLSDIKKNKTSYAAQKTAAYMCARIAANIAVGRNVKRYPRFYLVESGVWRAEGK